MRPLDGVLVVECGGSPASRYAAHLLASAGARVVRIAEPEAQDTLRQRAERLYYDSGSSIAVVDGESGRRDLFALAVAHADVILDSREADAAEADADLARRDGLVHVAVTPFGRTGERRHWRASDLTLQAFGGFLWLSGRPDREPVKAAVDQVHVTGGRAAAFAALTGLFGGPKPGGWIFDVALAELAATLPPFHVQQYAYTGAIAGRGPAVEPPLDGQHVPTEDGFITFATGNTPPEMFSALFDNPTLVDPNYLTPEGRQRFRTELEAAVHAVSRRCGKQELFRRAMELNIVAGTVQTVDDLLQCPQLAERAALEPVSGAGVRIPRAGFGPGGFSFEPPAVAAEVSEAEARAVIVGHTPASMPSRNAREPLAGTTIISFEDVIAMPWATVQLARLGARVIRVESRTRLQSRHWGVYPHNAPGPEFWNEGANHAHLYRSKECLALDLGDARGVQVALAVMHGADVVMENFRPGVLDRLGLGPRAVRAAAPSAVQVASSGFGETGPYRSMGAFARTIDAMSGLTDLTGYQDGPPQRANPSYMDMVSGWNIAIATMLGLIARERGAEPPRIDHSMYEAGVSTVGVALVERQLGGPPPRRRGNADDGWLTQGLFEAAGGCLVAVSVRDQRDRECLVRLCGVVGERGEPDLSGWLAGLGGAEAERALQEAGIAASVVRTGRDVTLDSWLHERGFFDWVATALREGEYVRPFPGPVVRLADPVPSARPLAHARLGEQNESLLTAAGFDGLSIAVLARDGVIGDRPVDGIAPPPRPLNLDALVERGVLSGYDPDFEAVVAALRKRWGPR